MKNTYVQYRVKNNSAYSLKRHFKLSQEKNDITIVIDGERKKLTVISLEK
jgi:hypothetical protein